MAESIQAPSHVGRTFPGRVCTNFNEHALHRRSCHGIGQRSPEQHVGSRGGGDIDEQSDTNKPGILHVKCAVADGEWLFLSSANLTQQAFTINMELGMLVRGGTMPGRIEQQFERLIKVGELEPID